MDTIKPSRSMIDDRTMIIIIFGTVLILWVFFGTWLGVYHVIDDDKAGKLGDAFGILSSFFTSLAFAGLIVTIRLQMKELRETRAEFVQQNETLRMQRFENTFFNLLQSQVELLKLIDLRDERGQITSLGRDCFKVFKERLDRSARKYTVREMDPLGMLKTESNIQRFRQENPIAVEVTLEHYRDLYKTLQGDLGHYFRNLYHIIRLIDESSEISDKMKYVRFVRAQLSSFELVILFYNCLTVLGEKFRPLIERYHLLKNMDRTLLISPFHEFQYNASAYGRT